MDPVTILLSVIAVIEGFVGVLQLVQMIGTHVVLARIQPVINELASPWIGDVTEDKQKLRVSLFKSVAHGVMNALNERAGSAAGVAARANKAAAIGDLLQGGSVSALAAIPGKIDVPYLGKVTIAEALQAFNALRSLLGQGGALQLQLPQTTSTGGAGYPQ